MKRLSQRKRTVTGIKRFFQMLTVFAVAYTFYLAAVSDANTLSLGAIFIRLLGCALIMLIAMHAVDICSATLKVIDRQIARKKRYLATHNLFTMSFAALCDNFNKSGVEYADTIRTGRVLGEFEWLDGSKHDHLRRWAISNGLPYLHTFSGSVWFSEDGFHWQTADFEVKDGNRVTIHERVPVFNLVGTSA